MEAEGKISPEATPEGTPEGTPQVKPPEKSAEKSEDTPEDRPEDTPEDPPLSMEDRRGLLQSVLSRRNDVEDGDEGTEDCAPSEDGSPDHGKGTAPPPPHTHTHTDCKKLDRVRCAAKLGSFGSAKAYAITQGQSPTLT